jgi:hypothetical protein
MGYNTDFSGILTYKNPITDEELEYLQEFMGADCRDNPEWGRTDLTWIDLDADIEGVYWNGSEKTYDLPEKINLIISEMQEKFPEFGLEGELYARGEDPDDMWVLVMENNTAIEKTTKVVLDEEITCPHCKEKFRLESLN